MAYPLALPPELSRVHNVFYVSMLRRYVADPSYMLYYEPLEVKEDATYIEQRVATIDTKEHPRTKTFY